MTLLSGKDIKEKIRKELFDEVLSLRIPPTLAIIQIGKNSESEVYIHQKKKFAESIGVEVLALVFSEDTSQEEILNKIDVLNDNENVKGIIVQLPIPKNLNKRIILDAIDFKKDIDGLGTIQSGFLSNKDKNTILPATVRGILTLFDYYEIDLVGKNVVIVGRSDLVGKPLAFACLHKNATVTICHSHTKNLQKITQNADILIVACGVPKMITADFVCEGQVVVDVGIHKKENGLCGDVDFEAVSKIVSALSPVPGGVGPLTVASLFQNLMDSCLEKV